MTIGRIGNLMGDAQDRTPGTQNQRFDYEEFAEQFRQQFGYTMQNRRAPTWLCSQDWLSTLLTCGTELTNSHNSSEPIARTAMKREIALLTVTLTALPAIAQHAPPPVLPNSNTTIVQTKQQLLSALSIAQPGDVVFVLGTSDIDLTGTWEIAVPPGVTLASDRNLAAGKPGARLRTAQADNGNSNKKEVLRLFVLSGAGSRVSGLRLVGPDSEIGSGTYYQDNQVAIVTVGTSDALVDNNEIRDWSYAGIASNDSIETWVYGNDFHNIKRTGLGYGVVVNGSTSALIQLNTFEQIRHAIAGDSIRTQRYDARNNIILDYSQAHAFDMHGEAENSGRDPDSPFAGDVIYISRNTFLKDYQEGIVVRGIPKTGAWITGNCFAHHSDATPAAHEQWFFHGNFFVGANAYAGSSFSCHESIQPYSSWHLWRHGEPWLATTRYTFDVSELGFGDFDGDGKSDAIRVAGASAYFSPGAASQFKKLQGFSMSCPMPNSTQVISICHTSDFRFEDFTGDGVTDVFYRDEGGQWRIFDTALRRWEIGSSSSIPLASLRFGDFNGDGRADVFRASGTQWYYSSGGQGPWTPLASASNFVEHLRFGNFDGDQKTDVFASFGGGWKYSSGGARPWSLLQTSGVAIDKIRIADMDGDGVSDVFSVVNGTWLQSASGTAPSTPIAQSGCPINRLFLADFSGDAGG